MVVSSFFPFILLHIFRLPMQAAFDTIINTGKKKSKEEFFINFIFLALRAIYIKMRTTLI
ncbi:hypothetical protein F120042H4_25400 [Faecalimonas umbilicata]